MNQPPSLPSGPGADAAEPTIACPVAKEQRPLEEYKQLERSWFFSWPARGTAVLIRSLLLAWLGMLPLSLVVSSGSWSLKDHHLGIAAAAFTFSLGLPLVLLLRQWLGWSYVKRRLLSEKVEYEESGWYDGQVWEKPLAWRQQDLLVARHQVGPVLQKLRQGILWILLLMGVGTGLCQAL
ncbi:MAG: CGLD27 family protein [Cyanobacteriota bacterium]